MHDAIAKETSMRAALQDYCWQHDGRAVPLGVGCAGIYLKWQDKTERRETISFLHEAYDEGVRYFDTSGDYGDSELLLGELIKDADRKKLFIASKAPYPLDGSRKRAFEVFKRTFYLSFERLKTDFIDFYQIHDTNSFAVCADDAIPFLKERKKDGMIGYMGLGTRSLKAHEHAIVYGSVDGCLSHYEYNLLSTASKRLQELARQNDVAFVNASCLMPGYLVDYSGNLIGTDSEQDDNLPFSLAQRKKNAAKIRGLCERMGMNPLAAALQFSISGTDVSFTLVGLNNTKELKACIQNIDAVIYPEQWAAIKRLMRENPTLDISEEYKSHGFLTKKDRDE